MAETASRVRPLVEGDDAGGGDESRQAKRQAVEVIKLTGLSHDDVRKIGNDISAAEAERTAASEGIPLLRDESYTTGFPGVYADAYGKYTTSDRFTWYTCTTTTTSDRRCFGYPFNTAAEAALHYARFLSAQKRGEEYSSELAINLPPDVFGLVASNLDAQSIKLMLSTCKTWRKHGADQEFWEVICKEHYPRVPLMLACMPPPHPPWRQLYLQQLRAERPLRCKVAGVLPPTTTSLHDYSYGVEIYGAPIHDEKQGPPLVAKYGRFGECTDRLGISAVKLWDKEPAWSSKIVTDFRGSQSEAAWINSDGHRIVSELRARVLITRPGDLASFCLYDGFVGRVPCHDGRDPFNGGSDLFQVSFAKTTLPLAGAAALDMKSRRVRYTGATVDTTLYLRANRRQQRYGPNRATASSSQQSDPLHGELQFRFYLHGGLDVDDEGNWRPRITGLDDYSHDHNEIVRYFESFAPF